jgi:hypothetical protein
VWWEFQSVDMSTLFPALELCAPHDVLSTTQLEALPPSLLRGVSDDVGRDVLLEGINEISLEEFLERLGADAADLYLPCAPLPVFELEGVRVGSARALLVRLETLREELELDLPVEDRTRALSAQRGLWKALSKGARTVLETGQVLFIPGAP